MTKKFLSLLLSVVMVIGLLPSFSVSAESTVYIDHNFESFTAGTACNDSYTDNTTWYNTGDSETATSSFKVYKNTKATVLDGLDGNTTNVVEFTLNSAGGFNNSQNGTVKFIINPVYTAPGEISTFSPSGLVVYDMDVYIDENTVNGYIYPIAIRDQNIGIAEDFGKKSYDLKPVSNGWHHITAVVDLNNTSTPNVIGYVDGECISYNKRNRSTVTNTFQPYGKDFPGYQKLVLDNVKVYNNPEATSAASEFYNLSNVPVSVSPTVEFTQKVLGKEINSDGSVSSCATIDFTNMSDGSKVEIESVSISQDGKILTITPAADLRKGTQYKIEVSDVKDMYNQTVDPYEFSFTTVEPENIVVSDAPVFTKEDLFDQSGSSTTITELEDGYINASFTFENTGSESQDAIILAVLKNGSTIESFQFARGTLESNGTLTFNGGFNVDDYQNQSIEIFVWDSLYGMTPLADKFIINKNGVTQE